MKNTDQELRVALYARVSTTDPETQLREYAQRRDFKVVGELIDYASGTSENRTHYKPKPKGRTFFVQLL
jgi:DNA invertase Pin-like site-specific DNA recombinase